MAGGGKKKLSLPLRPGLPHLSWRTPSHTSHHSPGNILPSPHAREKATIFQGHPPSPPPLQTAYLSKGAQASCSKESGLVFNARSQQGLLAACSRGPPALGGCSDKGRLHKDNVGIPLPTPLTKAPDRALAVRWVFFF